MKFMINNELVSRDAAKISLMSDGLLHGFGLFETMRTRSDLSVVLLDRHIDRLLESARKIGLSIEYSKGQLLEMVERLVWGETSPLRIKIVAIPNIIAVSSTALDLENHAKYSTGLSIMNIERTRSMPEIKSISYLDCLTAYHLAVEKGFDEAVLVDHGGQITEGSRSNLFWIKGGTLMTAKNGVLPGITRKFIIESSTLPFRYGQITPSELENVDEVFLTNSIWGIAPVIQINKKRVSQGKPGDLTQKLMAQYRVLLEKER